MANGNGSSLTVMVTYELDGAWPAESIGLILRLIIPEAVTSNVKVRQGIKKQFEENEIV
jgi:hypothetical protein